MSEFRDPSSDTGGCLPRRPATYASGTPRVVAGDPHPVSLAPRETSKWLVMSGTFHEFGETRGRR